MLYFYVVMYLCVLCTVLIHLGFHLLFPVLLFILPSVEYDLYYNVNNVLQNNFNFVSFVLLFVYIDTDT